MYLYPNVVDAYPNPASTWTNERFRMPYNRSLKIYRSVDNRIDFQLRNGDQKKFNFTGSYLVFKLINKENNDLIIEKDCSVDDASVGRLYVTITEAELRDLEPGFYRYSLVKETRSFLDGLDEYTVSSSGPLYFDSQYGAEADLEVMGDVSGLPYDTITVDKFNKLVDYDVPVTSSNEEVGQFANPRPNYAQNIPGNRYEETFVSSLIDGGPNLTTANSLHTFQIYLDNYDGDLILQGSLGEGGRPAEGTWSDIETWTLSGSNPNFIYNLTAKYNWFRFKYIPTENNAGTIDKILYR